MLHPLHPTRTHPEVHQAARRNGLRLQTSAFSGHQSGRSSAGVVGGRRKYWRHCAWSGCQIGRWTSKRIMRGSPSPFHGWRNLSHGSKIFLPSFSPRSAPNGFCLRFLERNLLLSVSSSSPKTARAYCNLAMETLPHFVRIATTADCPVDVYVVEHHDAQRLPNKDHTTLVTPIAAFDPDHISVNAKLEAACAKIHFEGNSHFTKKKERRMCSPSTSARSVW